MKRYIRSSVATSSSRRITISRLADLVADLAIEQFTQPSLDAAGTLFVQMFSDMGVADQTDYLVDSIIDVIKGIYVRGLKTFISTWIDTSEIADMNEEEAAKYFLRKYGKQLNFNVIQSVRVKNLPDSTNQILLYAISTNNSYNFASFYYSLCIGDDWSIQRVASSYFNRGKPLAEIDWMNDPTGPDYVS